MENFEHWYAALSVTAKKEAFKFMVNDSDFQSVWEDYLSKSEVLKQKGLFTGPVSANEKCIICGK